MFGPKIRLVRDDEWNYLQFSCQDYSHVRQAVLGMKCHGFHELSILRELTYSME